MTIQRQTYVQRQMRSGGCGTNYTNIDILIKGNVPARSHSKF
jgi:hypothetical protein